VSVPRRENTSSALPYQISLSGEVRVLNDVSATGRRQRRCIRNLFLFAALFVMSIAAVTVPASAAESQSEAVEPLQARFRGCDSAGWCRFWIESLDPLAKSLYRVYPRGVAQTPFNAQKAVAVRDRLNELLASMVHQHKRIVICDPRELDDGAYSAIITVNEMNVAEDPLLQALQNDVAAPTP
jgi:hypothetical protein